MDTDKIKELEKAAQRLSGRCDDVSSWFSDAIGYINNPAEWRHLESAVDDIYALIEEIVAEERKNSTDLVTEENEEKVEND